jgi:hypothetical protein
MNYKDILEEMDPQLEKFSKESSKLSAYKYEKDFRAIVTGYEQSPFQASIGEIPTSGNEKICNKIKFGKVSNHFSTSYSINRYPRLII